MIGVLRTICVLATAFGLTACARADDLTEPLASAAVTTSPETTTEPPPSQFGTSNGVRYGVTTTSIDGFSPDGLGTWKAMRGHLVGGDPAVARAFNDASQTVARRQLSDAFAGAGDGTTPWSFEANGQVTFRQPMIAQVITSAFYLGAHSSTEAGTVVVDGRTARPVAMADVFADERAGLDRLSGQTKAILPKINGWQGVMPDEPGNAPRPENFANWIPTADGMELHFPATQFKVGVAETVTVPWSQLTDLLAPNMADLATG